MGEGGIVKFWYNNPFEGYRRCTYMLMDQDLVAVSPCSVCRVLSKEGLMKQWSKKESRIGIGFVQPLAAHEHWHIDISYLNIKGTFYYLCSVLDGCSRCIVHHEIRESMKESHVELAMQSSK
jgi:putative transposase